MLVRRRSNEVRAGTITIWGVFASFGPFFAGKAEVGGDPAFADVFKGSLWSDIRGSAGFEEASGSTS